MPAKSPEAIARKKQKRIERRRPVMIADGGKPLPPVPTTKAGLMQMLADAVRNTKPSG